MKLCYFVVYYILSLSPQATQIHKSLFLLFHHLYPHQKEAFTDMVDFSLDTHDTQYPTLDQGSSVVTDIPTWGKAQSTDFVSTDSSLCLQETYKTM